MEPLIKASEAAKLLGVHEKTLREWAAQGVVPAFRYGARGHWYFRASSLDAWIQEQMRAKSEVGRSQRRRAK